MPSYPHKKLIEQILRLDEVPADPKAYSDWIGAGAHLQFLETNAKLDEIIIYASGPFTFIHSIVVPNDALASTTKADLLRWDSNPYQSIASYCYGGGRDEMWVDRTGRGRGCPALDSGRDLVFGRTFEGWSGAGRVYFELSQEYSHLSGIHWRPEHDSYCRYDDNGDLEQSVSITMRGDGDDVSLVSFTWSALEEYLAISQSSLVRMFDFTLLRRESFSAWPEMVEAVVHSSAEFFYRQKRAPDCAYTRGVQIVPPRRSLATVSKDVKNGWIGQRAKQYVEFIAYDWRNGLITRISTDPKATTNYFQIEDNIRPFELSPAFFRPEVLSKYKTDRDKYTVGDRDVQCRASWGLRGFDVNEAGQVHAYICDLRHLPYTEQLHWLSYNEEPKAGISNRAFVNDFKGEFVNFQHPREAIIGLTTRWHKKRVTWWTLRDQTLLNRANPPLTSSRDEWSDAFMDLSQLVIEGFEIKSLRKELDSVGVTYSSSDGSIALLEKVLSNQNNNGSLPKTLDGLRAVQRIRSKVRGHAAGSEGKQLAQDAILEHGTFTAHFKHVCLLVVSEMEMVQHAFGVND